MFVNRKQHKNAKYGRDECISCLLKLGLGLIPISKIMAVNKHTIGKIIRFRIPTPRYEGFDRIFIKARANDPKRKRDFSQKTFEKLWTQHLRNEMSPWDGYDTFWFQRFRHLDPRRVEKKNTRRKNLKTNHPERYLKQIEYARKSYYKKRGYSPDEIPEKGFYVSKLTDEEKADLRRIRRKRDDLRSKVVEVWKNKVRDVASMNRVGCSVSDFTAHIESQMKIGWTRENYGSVWNFDHIVPLSQFDVFDFTEARKANHYSNIRPCCVIENSTKGAQLDYLNLCATLRP